MKAGPDRKYTAEFREAAVRQVLDGGRSVPQVARSLEMSDKTLENWVGKARRGQPLLKRSPAQPVDEVRAELARLRQDNARLKLEKEILKNRPPRAAAAHMDRNILCLHCDNSWKEAACFLEVPSSSKNLAQGKLRTQLWWHFA
jgi:transposase